MCHGHLLLLEGFIFAEAFGDGAEGGLAFPTAALTSGDPLAAASAFCELIFGAGSLPCATTCADIAGLVLGFCLVIFFLSSSSIASCSTSFFASASCLAAIAAKFADSAASAAAPGERKCTNILSSSKKLTASCLLHGDAPPKIKDFSSFILPWMEQPALTS